MEGNTPFEFLMSAREPPAGGRAHGKVTEDIMNTNTTAEQKDTVLAEQDTKSEPETMREPEAVDEEAVDLDHVLVVKEPEEEAYSISESNLVFDMEIRDDGSLAVTGGQIETEYFIQNSTLEWLKSWRYELHGVNLESIHVDAAKNTLTYDFTLEDPTDFLEYTSIEGDEEESDG